jgi:gliding motility-associated-like protein
MRKFLVTGALFLYTGLLVAQCPDNINFANSDLTNWGAYTGNLAYRPNSIQQTYPANVPGPSGTTGTAVINEYGISIKGISVNTVNGTDPFGLFETIPTINGYNYNYSVLLGSTTVTSGGGPVRGGYVRGISYTINVPAGSPSIPYTITYAYAMVLENGSHATSNQPIFYATVTSPDSVISCASATYNLPTIFGGIEDSNNGPDSIFILDENIAAAQGFTLSSLASPNVNGFRNESPFRVWTKGWREVTFNLAPYRGKQVTVTFEANNCVPGGHFAYSYIALRNDCAGLEISGPNLACINSTVTYSIPSLANAVYNWTVPAGWQILSSSGNIITVKPGTNGGVISVNGNNGCTNLNASLTVQSSLPTIAGTVTPNFEVCTGNNSSTLTLTGNRGKVIKWVSSADGISWGDIGNANSNTFTAINLNKTTHYRAIVQNGGGCTIDTSGAASVTVFEKSVGGNINPSIINICLSQNKDANLTITGKRGSINNWQWSDDNLVWNNFNPVFTDSVFSIKDQTAPVRYYRAMVQLGVCPAVTSSISKITLVNAEFPKAIISPADTTICFGGTAGLTANILLGGSYQWLNTAYLSAPANSSVPSNPFTVKAVASPPPGTIYYPISILNSGCPNALVDTFTVNVLPKIVLSTPADTFIVAGQPLQLTAQIDDPSQYSFQWSPSTGLSNTTIYNPAANLGSNIETISYTVKATDNNYGCTQSSTVKVKVFKTGPDIFVPSAFTPNNDRLNDILKPIAAGISKMEYFKVFNRYGQLIYSTTATGKGWDGTLNGVVQPLGVYIWAVNAITYTGNRITKKGTVSLIR